ncbi:hypothetical protein CVT24_008647 [Panaeolus cyanescens]|uniref:Uncharacterized protein n=1 Tax=Panaeolus cyanescens TaxID=181874 RepID=A0A409VBB1_9AGAR|nr:hypothetical protein CVT24_008647 [Panaeolus cyanescens]
MRPSSVNAVCFSLSRQIISKPVTRCSHRKLSALAQKVEQTPRTRPEPISIPHESAIHKRTDPYVLMASELTQIRKNLLNLLGTAHPGLTGIAECYFLHPSKQLRSLLVLLFSRATNGLGGRWDQKEWNAAWETTSRQSEILDRPLTTSSTLYEWNPSMPDHTASFESVFPLQQGVPRPEPPPMPSQHASLSQNLPPDLVSIPSILPTQIRLAQIVEMVHVASLLHDTISSSSDAKTDSSDSTTEPAGFGNKLSILGGDFLLGRASTALSRLGESEVVELIASVISNLVEGEIMRMQEVRTPTLGLVQGPSSLPVAWDQYMKKTYLKTASLFAKGARSAVILGGCKQGDIWRDVAYAYGRNLGIAYQLLEDTIEFNHMQPGLATAPALLATEECPQLLPLIQRNFAQPGDTQLAVEYVQGTTGIKRTRLLAEAYASKARDTLKHLPEGESRQALEGLTDIVINRTW